MTSGHPRQHEDHAHGGEGPLGHGHGEPNLFADVTGGAPILPTGLSLVLPAMVLWDRLSAEQRERILIPFDSADRDDWDFLPQAGRRGLPLRDMTHEQQILAHRLVASALAPEAYGQVVTTINQEHLLRELEWNVLGPTAVEFRDPGGYFLTLFGVPSLDETWGLRFVGHHLSLNFTVVRQDWVSVTPMMLGAQPGRFGTTRNLSLEEDAGFALLDSLSGTRRSEAIIHHRSPIDLVTKSVRQIGEVEYPGYFTVGRHHLRIDDNDRQALVYMREHPRGVSYGSLTESEQTAFRQLLECYIGKVKPDQLAFEMDRIVAAGIDALHFAWAGGTTLDEGHYYRIQGPVTVIEFDNTEDDANHIHSIWRDPKNDFGSDLLLSHVVDEHAYDRGHVHDPRVERPARMPSQSQPQEKK